MNCECRFTRKYLNKQQNIFTHILYIYVVTSQHTKICSQFSQKKFAVVINLWDKHYCIIFSEAGSVKRNLYRKTVWNLHLDSIGSLPTALLPFVQFKRFNSCTSRTAKLFNCPLFQPYILKLSDFFFSLRKTFKTRCTWVE